MKPCIHVLLLLSLLGLFAILASCAEDQNGKDCWTYAVEATDLAERCDRIVSIFYCCGFDWLQSAGEDGPLIGMTKEEAFQECVKTYDRTPSLQCTYQCQLQYADCVTWRDCAVACSE